MEQLHTFEIKDQFYLDGNPFRIISGGMHYFRVLPEHWEDRLLKLKALGCNTVETVVPWNLHEPKKGEFDFTGEKLHGLTDLVGYVKLAQKLGLWVILRPSPYICAEWEFGGFPAWLLADGDMALRTSDERYLRHVRDYYKVLMPKVTPHVCRHTFCFNMAKSGMNPKTLQYLMGHSDIGVTMNTYTHIGYDDAKEELERMTKVE